VRIKSYFANSVTEAINRARNELGPEAMIIASNRTEEGANRLGSYEVVFGLADSNAGAEVQAPVPTVPPGLERLRERMEELRKSVSKKREQASAGRIVWVGPKIVAWLSNAGFPQAVAEDLARTLQVRSKDDRNTTADPLGALLAERIRFIPKLGAGGPGRSVVALVGPPGAGKTSTLVKLAMKYGLAAGRPVRFVSTDTYRLGGSDLLGRYARWMGVQLDLPPSMEALEQSFGSGDRNELLLIDTPGYSVANAAASLPLAGLFSQRAGVDVHLVLPAYASGPDLLSMVARFKPFLPSKVLFTGIDMAGSVAPALAAALTSELPVSFLGTGDQVPEDLEEAASARLAGHLLPCLMEAAATAA
jgi:flagellar biosynthesis protein FlhF